MKMMLRTLPLGLLLPAICSIAHAADESPVLQASYNLSLTSDYRYRGISQTRLRPALQGGADLVHSPSGLYAGTWLSTIRWIRDGGGDSRVEMDIYAGKRGTIGDFSYDVGALVYLYPGTGLSTNPNTRELYVQGGYGPAYIKYSHAFSNLFGTPDSKHSGYLDVGANLPLRDDLTLNLHAGRQRVDGHGELSYTDYKVGVTKAFGTASVALAVIGTNTDVYVGPGGRNLGRTGLVLTLTKTF